MEGEFWKVCLVSQKLSDFLKPCPSGIQERAGFINSPLSALRSCCLGSQFSRAQPSLVAGWCSGISARGVSARSVPLRAHGSKPFPGYTPLSPLQSVSFRVLDHENKRKHHLNVFFVFLSEEPVGISVLCHFRKVLCPAQSRCTTAPSQSLLPPFAATRGDLHPPRPSLLQDLPRFPEPPLPPALSPVPAKGRSVPLLTPSHPGRTAFSPR